MSGTEDHKEVVMEDADSPMEEADSPMEEADKPMPSTQQEETVIKKKYGGLLPKKPPLIIKDHERAFFDSADWALGKQGVAKPKGPLEALRPKLQPSQQQTRYRKSHYAPSEGEGLQYENNSEIGVFSELTNANCLVAIDVEERLSALGNIPFSYNGHAALTHLDLDREEEEEDECDDVAVGTEQHAGDCLYMKDVKIVEYDDIEELDTHCELLNSLRANPVADKEDAEAYANCDTSLISGNVDAGDYNGQELDVKHPKPILKKGGKLTEKTSKRVRFLCEPEDENVDQHSSDSSDFNFMLFRGLFNE